MIEVNNCVASLMIESYSFGLLLSLILSFYIDELMEMVELSFYWFGLFLVFYLSHGEGYKSLRCKKNSQQSVI